MKLDNHNQVILIFGANGMIGHALFSRLSLDNNLKVYGTVRNPEILGKFPPTLHSKLISGIDISKLSNVANLIKKIKPSVIINAIGMVKQLPGAHDLSLSFVINSLWPHQLVGLAELSSSHVIQLSSDCVFSGNKGMYLETNIPDPQDIYGQTKWLGELYEPNTLTIRTSTIGHELASGHGLLEWFLAQTGSVTGYSEAVYSGISTFELAKVIKEYIIPNILDLSGILHISSKPITKYDLLRLIATKYSKRVTINKTKTPVIDRSLDSHKFSTLTGYQVPEWDQMVEEMHHAGI